MVQVATTVAIVRATRVEGADVAGQGGDPADVPRARRVATAGSALAPTISLGRSAMPK